MLAPSGTSRRGRLPLIALAAVVVAIVTACGSTATPAPGPTPTPSPTVTPTVAPLSSMVAVPTTRLDAPANLQVGTASAAALQKALTNIAAGVPGVQAAVVYPDGSTWAGSAGKAVIATGQAMTGDTLLAIGSVTKTFTGAVVMKLVEQGTLSLADPLSKYLPSFPNAANITLLELLNHTSGISDIFEPHAYYYIQARKSVRWTPDRTLTQIGAPYFAPGQGYHYSSTNYIILGMVVEAATGQTLASLIRSDFLTPLGLDHTFLQSEETPVGPLAHGYLGSVKSPKDVSAGQTLIPYVSAATAVGAAGGMASTATDVARWASALYSGRVFGPATLASILDTTATVPYKLYYPYGLGVEEYVLNGHLAWGHRGHVDGFWSMVVYVPDSGIAVALLANADWVNPVTQMNKLLTAAIPAA